MRTLRLALLSSALAVGVAPDAGACGTFRSRVAETSPSPERERVVVVFDPAAKREHLVREITFRAGAEPFAFVVPVPARPELGEVAVSPFDRLEREHAPEAGHAPDGLAKAASGGAAARRALSDALVVEHREVAGFDATVLEGRDPSLVSTWLETNGFALGPDGARWIGRYARPGFHLVALRFAAPTKPGQLISRVLRLSFDTSLPFYPYGEPLDTPDRAGRELTVWVVSPWAHAAVSTWVPPTVGPTPERQLARPWSEQTRRRDVDLSWLGDALGVPVVPLAVVTTFIDRNVTRETWDDVVLVPAAGDACGGCAEGAAPLAALADASLGGLGATVPPATVPPRPWSRTVPPGVLVAPPAEPLARGWLGSPVARSFMIAGTAAAGLCVVALVIMARSRRRAFGVGAASCAAVGAVLVPLGLLEEQRHRERERAVAVEVAKQRAEVERLTAAQYRLIAELTGSPLLNASIPPSLDVAGLTLDVPAPTLPTALDVRRARWGELLSGASPVGAVPEVAPGVSGSVPHAHWLDGLGDRCAAGQPRVGVLDVVIEPSKPPLASWVSGPFASDFASCAARYLDASLKDAPVGERVHLSLRLGTGAAAWPVASSVAGFESVEVVGADDALAVRRAVRRRLASASFCRPTDDVTTTKRAVLALSLDASRRGAPRVVSASGADAAWARAARCVANQLTETAWPMLVPGRVTVRVALGAVPAPPPRPQQAACPPGDPLCGL